MPKYINADDIYNGMREHRFEARHITIGEFVDYLPSADVAEVKHGVWKTVNEDWDVYECSVCQHEFMLIAGKPRDNSYNFCPNCGADMDTRGETE